MVLWPLRKLHCRRCIWSLHILHFRWIWWERDYDLACQLQCRPYRLLVRRFWKACPYRLQHCPRRNDLVRPKYQHTQASWYWYTNSRNLYTGSNGYNNVFSFLTADGSVINSFSGDLNLFIQVRKSQVFVDEFLSWQLVLVPHFEWRHRCKSIPCHGSGRFRTFRWHWHADNVSFVSKFNKVFVNFHLFLRTAYSLVVN